MSKPFYVYILASRKHGTLYIGVTSNLNKRTYEHKSKAVKGFTERYGVHMLVYFEVFEDARTAIAREKQLKKWKREWKIQLIEAQNPEWVDLSNSLF
jgi:putative endonuclease